ncbi:MAG: DNA polymerase III subunit gamma/tau [Alphaproteobacteria bacterium]|nr:DNA polymerase III subunit gamma/tau [Alphaproteobacteria bacterium SS10]
MDSALPGLDIPAAEDAAGYRVLARKYRPQSFDTLIGQEALVRTLRNAIASGRIHHGYMLTGVRGVGKTTTARLIARALNYVGPDGTGEATVGATDDCPVCQAIAEGRHVDVIEMDAASNTGVDDIREVIDGARYAPTEARYKVYIIDEVHMLSKNAFNALLKTLEEPPPSVIFIFATTEIRKVPVTVLSRCMRFDLRRVPAELLLEHFASIAEKEAVSVEAEALALIARAADGSVRDGLSLLDQAIALGDGKSVSAEEVRDMLGLADRQLIFDLMEAAVAGDAEKALETYGMLHNAGAEGVTVIQDMLELVHFITRCALVPTAAKGADVPEAEATRAAGMAEQLAMPALTRMWQILMTGLGEVQRAPEPHMAAEMVILRLCHSAGLPDPSDLIKRLTDGELTTGRATPAGAGAASGPTANQNAPQPMGAPPQRVSNGNTALKLAPTPAQPAPQPVTPQALPGPDSFAAAVALLGAHNELRLEAEFKLDARLVSFSEGRIELEENGLINSNQALRFARFLSDTTGSPWAVELVDQPGLDPLRANEKAAEEAEMEAIRQHPLVAAVLEAFPDAKIERREIADEADDAAPLASEDAMPGDPDLDMTEAPFDPDDPGFDDDYDF